MRLKSLKITFIIFVILLCSSCHVIDDNQNDNVSDNVEVSETSEVKTYKEQFIETYGYDIDTYSYLSEDNLYRILLQNPIDQWAKEHRSIAETTVDMLECENMITQNFEREITASMLNLKELLSADLYANLEQHINRKIELVLNEKALSEDIMRHLDFYGTYSSVLVETQVNDQYRNILFELKYIEYISRSDDMSIQINFSASQSTIYYGNNSAKYYEDLVLEHNKFAFEFLKAMIAEFVSAR